MMLYIIIVFSSDIISCLLGWIYARRLNKHENDTAIMVIANLKATIEIYKITNEQQKEYFIKKNDELKTEIKKLKKQ